ncbi:hypothetical protein SDRG_08726 [Saprolegnia diclina VS20]|uniref:Kinesin motor domain-containing protein n=1 Tax=Saprolegnia diclina (strain VS20) TaxID=1156394 RepID=T0QFW1_SAPDV|nr:hypothetical protein SDRG_08726 [Saprolegnia diclina VS20]EQC33621.1 hypothetical protein SDRG_08726 [Saprolegnia diclina VS20]|eukprot:XP_008612844.1 hypothetical protein SDRG_08726 [Saprolegnia diclina VS20]
MSTSPLPFTTKSHVELHDKRGTCLHKSSKRKYVHTSHGAGLHHLHGLLHSLHAPELAEIGAIVPPEESMCTYLLLDGDGDWVQLTMDDFTSATASPLHLKLVLRPKLDRPTPRRGEDPGPRRVKRRQSLPLAPALIPRINATLTPLPLPIDAILVPNRAWTSLAFADASKTLYWLDELQGNLGSVDVTSGAVRVLQSDLRRPRQLHLGTSRDAICLYFLQGEGDLCVYDISGVVRLVQCAGPVSGFCITPDLASLLVLESAPNGATYHVVSYMHYATSTDVNEVGDARCVLFDVDAPTVTATPSALCVTDTGALCVAWTAAPFVTVCRSSDDTSMSVEPWDFSSVIQHHVSLPAECTAITYHATSRTLLLGLADADAARGGLARLLLPRDHALPTLHLEPERVLPVLALTHAGSDELYYCVRRQGYQHDILTWHLSTRPDDDEPPSNMSPTPATPESTPQRVHIKVLVRCRPLLAHEEAAGQRSVVACDGNRVYVEPIHAYQKPRAFNFDTVFGPSTTQEDLFATSIQPIVQHAISGYTCTVFAYGQTGSGKTHSMQGHRGGADAGLMYRAIATVFASPAVTSVRMSYVEIYNEEILDLLAASLRRQSDRPQVVTTSSKALRDVAKKRGVRMKYEQTRSRDKKYDLSDDDESAGRPSKLHIVKHALHGVRVHGLHEVSVATAADAYELLELAIQCRQQSATLCNKESSRSHAIFTLYTDTTLVEDGQSIQASGQLRLVDLSGSENYERAGCLKDRQVEAANIGQGLLALGRVIKALVEGWKHVPYRESKLTRLLEDSIGGSALTTLLLAVAPGSAAVDETLSTLSYAQMAQQVVNRPTRVHALLQPTRTKPIEPVVVVATPWVGHVPIRTSPPRLTKPADERVLHATTEEWRANLLVHKARVNPLSRRTTGILQKIFDTYDAKATGVLSRFEVRRVFMDLLCRPKESAPKTLTFAEFVDIFQTLLQTDPQIAQDIITTHGYTLNLERTLVAPLPAGVRCLRQLQQHRPASAPAARAVFNRKTT